MVRTARCFAFVSSGRVLDNSYLMLIPTVDAIDGADVAQLRLWSLDKASSSYHFKDGASFEQFALNLVQVGGSGKWLVDRDAVRAWRSITSRPCLDDPINVRLQIALGRKTGIHVGKRTARMEASQTLGRGAPSCDRPHTLSGSDTRPCW